MIKNKYPFELGLQMLEAGGWKFARIVGEFRVFRHPCDPDLLVIKVENRMLSKTTYIRIMRVLLEQAEREQEEGDS